jgi:ZIP family zinc transporter
MAQDAQQTMLQLILVTAAVGCATTLGALPVLLVREVSRRGYDTMLGLGAGLMLAAATLGLLPEAVENVRPHGVLDVGLLALVLAGFAVGVTLLWLLDRFIPHAHAGGHHEHMHGHEPEGHDHCQHKSADERARHQGWMIVGAMALHRLPEGFAIGASFASTATLPLGVMLAVAVGLQNAIEGAVMAAPLKRGGLGRGRLLAIVSLTGATVPGAAILGAFVTAAMRGALPFMLAVAAGALIYLTCNEIIPESHSHGNEKKATFGLLVGVVVILLLRVLVGE